MDSIAGTITRTYDLLDDLMSETTPNGTVDYSYDSAQRRQSMTVVGQTQVTYNWDAANNLLSIQQGTSNVSFAYDAINRRTQLTLPNGIVLTYAYDAASHITGMTWAQGQNQIGNLVYTYDAAGRVIEKSGSLASTNPPQAVTGNNFNNANEMTTYGTQPLTYDANGNLTSNGSNTYTWDARNHLSAISGSVTAAFAYDPFGRRTSKTVNGVTTQYLYDKLNPVQELQGGSVSANILTGLGIDEYFQRTDQNGTLNYLADMVQSTLALTNSSGAIVTQYSYDPFGNVTVSGAPSSNPYQFTGRENDGTGLYNCRARYYGPISQRFISQDPLDFAGGDVNLYQYVGNGSIYRHDPRGTGPVSGLILFALCSAYDAYSSNSLLAEEAALADKLEVIKKQIDDLQKGASSCSDAPDLDLNRWEQVQNLEKKALDLTEQLAARHAADIAQDLAVEAACAGLGGIAWVIPVLP